MAEGFAGDDSAEGPKRRQFGPRLRALTGVAVVVLIAVATTVAVPSLRERATNGIASIFGESVVASVEAAPPRLQLGPLPTGAPTPSSSGLSSTLDKLASVPELGTLAGVVVDPATGQTLWSRTPTKALTPGSTGKLLTAAAALLTLNPTSRLTTTVVAGATPDSVVVVGGGDPTLSSLPKGKDSVYDQPARLDDLIAQVRSAHPGPIHTVSIDLSRFTGPTQAPGWETADIEGGYFTPIEPLMLDGGRQGKPDELDPPRSATPGIDAGKKIAGMLGGDGSSVKVETAPSGARVLGSVSSAPVTDLVQNALRISDNVLAEALARQVAVATGGDPSFSGAVRSVLTALTSAGLDVGETRMVDGSGLSTDDEVSAKLLGQIMTAASAPEVTAESQSGSNQTALNRAGNGVSRAGRSTGSGSDADRTARLRPLLGGLPVAGGDGTLAARFTVKDDSALGKGYVRAKTGTLSGVSSLAGTVVDTDGRLLAFAWLSNGTSPSDSRPRLDALAAALRGCGCN